MVIKKTSTHQIYYLLIILPCLLFYSKNSNAEWIYVTEIGGSKQYYESDSIKKNNGLIFVKFMNDNTPWTPSGRRYQGPRVPHTSYVFHTFFNCSNQSYNVVYREIFTDHLASGNIVESVKVNDGWKFVDGNMKLWVSAMNLVCNKK